MDTKNSDADPQIEQAKSGCVLTILVASSIAAWIAALRAATSVWRRSTVISNFYSLDCLLTLSIKILIEVLQPVYDLEVLRMGIKAFVL